MAISDFLNSNAESTFCEQLYLDHLERPTTDPESTQIHVQLLDGHDTERYHQGTFTIVALQPASMHWLL